MNLHTRDGRIFNRRESAAKRADDTAKSGKGDVQRGLEQELSCMEERANLLFDRPKPKKRRWDPESVKEQASKWPKLMKEGGAREDLGRAEDDHKGITDTADAISGEAGNAKGNRVLIPVDENGSLEKAEAWPSYETMAAWLEEGSEQDAEPALDIPELEVSQQSLMDARAAPVGEAVADQDPVLEEVKGAIESGRGWYKKLQERAPANIKAMMRLIEPALKAKNAEGTKKKKVSCISYWTTFCAAYGLDAERYGRPLPGDGERRTLIVQEEMEMLAGFAGYVVMYPIQKGKSHNSVAHAERSVGVVKAYYRGKNGRTPGSGAETSFDYYIKDALRGLAKVYPTDCMKRAPLLADQMREIRRTMNLQDLKEATMWAPWVSQWQGVLRGSDILRRPEDKRKPCDKDKATHMGRLSWERIDPKENHGCEVRLRWFMKPSKTDQTGGKKPAKTFLKDDTEDALSLAAAIWHMLSLREKPKEGEEENTGIRGQGRERNHYRRIKKDAAEKGRGSRPG